MTWSSSCNFFWNVLDPTLVFFFKMKFFLNFQKNYKCWIKCISKKFTTTGSANTCNFFCIFKKNCNYWIKSFSKSKWTGLKLIFHLDWWHVLWCYKPNILQWPLHSRILRKIFFLDYRSKCETSTCCIFYCISKMPP